MEALNGRMTRKPGQTVTDYLFGADRFEFAEAAASSSTLIDRNRTPGHRFIGTEGDDRMLGNGSVATIFGGGGDDDISAGIGTGAVDVYGGYSLPGFDPRNPLAPSKWALDHDGSDTLQLGAGQKGKGGSEDDTYILHANIPEALATDMPTFNPWEGDRLVIVDDLGWSLNSWSVFETFREGGDKFVHLRDVQIVGHGAPDNFVREQHARIGFNDDFRGEHTETILEYSGGMRDEIVDFIGDFIL